MEVKKSEIFVEILLPIAIDAAFTYKASSDIEVGDIVKVEFRKKEIFVLVLKILNDAPENIAPEKIKSVLEKNLSIKFSKNQIKFLEAISSYNLANRGLVLRSMIGILNSNKTKKAAKEKIQKVEKEKFSHKNLSQSQKEVAQKVTDLFLKNPSSIALLDGVTGCGKTEIYFEIISKILSENSDSQILILLPEIALTSQLLTRFEEQFGFKPALWHSKILTKEKREIFYGVSSGGVKVLIGARSALLLPFANLKLIVIDEEHDSSFKQEDVFNFHARDMAIVKGKIENFPVILSSATPSLESYVNAVSGKYHHFILDQKFNQKTSVINLVDLRKEKLKSQEFLSQKLLEEIAKNLAKKNQTLLFLNRRGYAPVTLCKDCGKKYSCPNCDFNLVLHKAKNRLACHHCGHEEILKSECKFCAQKDCIISVGAGVEKVAEDVKRHFPESRIALFTSDNISSFVEAQECINQISNREIDIIIGTQMISKGYDFPHLTLAAIVDADGIFYSSDLRALEKTYQIFTQIIGRVGRHETQGQIIIQTYNTENFVFEKIIKNDKKDFYNFEMNNRKMLNLPPFTRLTKFDVSCFMEKDAENFARKLVSNFPMNKKVEVCGPAKAALGRLKNRHHFSVYLKTAKEINTKKLISDIVKSIYIPASIRVRIDVDCVS